MTEASLMLGSGAAGGAAAQFALDVTGLKGLAGSARRGDPEATRAAAQQFEALFLHEMIKGMRSTVPTNDLTNSRQTEFYQTLLDQQWAQVLAERGVGIADVLVEQLESRGYAKVPEEAVADDPIRLAALEPVAGRVFGPNAAGEPSIPFPDIPRGQPTPLESFAPVKANPARIPLSESDPTTVQHAPSSADAEQVHPAEQVPTSFIESLGGQSQGPLIGLGAGDGSTGALIDRQATSGGRLFPNWKSSQGGLLNGWGMGAPEIKGPEPFEPGARIASMAQHQQAFLEPLVAPAKIAGQRTGVPAELILAQAALETGWGRYQIQTADGSNSHNLFGIKAGGRWAGEVTKIPTHEFVNGQQVRIYDQFRVYPSYEAAFTDYARLIGTSQRYAPVTQAESPEQAARLLQAGGYATDPAYADKLIAIMGRIGP